MTEESEHHSPENEPETQIPPHNGPNYNDMLYRKFTSTCLSDIASSPEVRTLVFDIDSRSIFAKGKQTISNRLFEALKKTIEAGIHVWILSNSSKDFLEFLTRKQKEQLPKSKIGQIFMGGTYFKYNNEFVAISKFSKAELDLIKSGIEYHNLYKYVEVIADGETYYLDDKGLVNIYSGSALNTSASNLNQLFESNTIFNVKILRNGIGGGWMNERKFSKILKDIGLHFRTVVDLSGDVGTLYPPNTNKLDGVRVALAKHHSHAELKNVVVLSKHAVDLLAHYPNTIALQPLDSDAIAEAKCVIQRGNISNHVASFLEELIRHKAKTRAQQPGGQ